MDRLTPQQQVDVRRIAYACLRMLGPQSDIGGSIQDEIEHIQANLNDITDIEAKK